MRTLLVSHYFPPEIGAPQARLSEMATRWAGAGDEVQVLTGFPNHPTGVIHPGYRGKRMMEERIDGVDVVRTWVYATPNEGFVKKSLGHLSFMVSGLVLGWRRVKRPDVVVVSSPTFFSILTAWLLALRFRARFVVEVRDLWPGIFVELGVLTNRQMIWLLERLELAAYRAADHVVVVSEGFRQNLTERGVPAAKVSVITNGVETKRFAPRPVDRQVRASLGSEADEPLVVYIGALGISHGLDTVVGAARLQPEVQVALVGEGALKKQLVESAADVANLRVLDGVDRSRVAPILHAADLLVVSLRDVPLFTTFIPSKMFEYLASGTPVVGAVAGEAAAILEAAGAVVVPPEDPAALADAIAALLADPERRASQGSAGRAFVEERYSRSSLADRYRLLLHQTAGLGPPVGAGTQPASARADT